MHALSDATIRPPALRRYTNVPDPHVIFVTAFRSIGRGAIAVGGDDRDAQADEVLTRFAA